MPSACAFSNSVEHRLHMSAADQLPLALNPALDADRLAGIYAAEGRVAIDDILAQDSAEWLHNHLRGRADWLQVMNSGDRLIELDRPTRAGLSPDQQTALDQAVHAGARYGFQYRYESLRVPDDAAERAHSDDPLAGFASWWSGGEVRDFLRHVTGEAGIDFADAQGTAYSPGDFLTGHDDDFAGKNRLAAYVLGLTPQWRLEWGGLLLFHDAQERMAETWMPGFNRLVLFRVPQRHSVSEVTRAAAYRRYSITGWLRAAG